MKKEKQKNKTYQQNAMYSFNLSAALNFDLEIKVTETNVAQSNSQSIISKDCLTKKLKFSGLGHASTVDDLKIKPRGAGLAQWLDRRSRVRVPAEAMEDFSSLWSTFRALISISVPSPCYCSST